MAKSIVQFERNPSHAPVFAVSSHSSPEHLPLTITSLTSLLNISPPPGRASRPAFLGVRALLNRIFVSRAMKKYLCGVSAFMVTWETHS